MTLQTFEQPQGAPSDRGDTALLEPALEAGPVDFVPVPIEHILVGALAGIPVYLRTAHPDGVRYTLYSSRTGRFTDGHRKRLYGAAVRFIHLPKECYPQFRRQLERELEMLADDTSVSLHARALVIYQTGVELVNEVLLEGLTGRVERVATVARSVATLLRRDPKSFGHLFMVAQREFHSATHMVNVGTWMAALAAATGADAESLEAICTAGMVLDVGKQAVPARVLAKADRLSNEEWGLMRAHPSIGAAALRREGVKNEIILRITEEHHERMDGSGYPQALKADAIHPLSRLCAVIDSFEAMTALRPFRQRTRTNVEALEALRSETPDRYDRDAVEAWVELLRKTAESGALGEMIDAQGKIGRRRFERFNIDCPIIVRELVRHGEAWLESPHLTGHARSISRGGLGMTLDKPLKISGYVRVLLKGKGTLQDRTFEGQVMRCRMSEDGKFELGMRFCPTGEEEAASKAAAKRKA